MIYIYIYICRNLIDKMLSHFGTPHMAGPFAVWPVAIRLFDCVAVWLCGCVAVWCTNPLSLGTGLNRNNKEKPDGTERMSPSPIQLMLHFVAVPQA
jgi:hypothetical protein